MSLDEDDEEPYTPRRYHSQKKPLTTQIPFTEHPGRDYEGERDEHGIYIRETSPSNIRPLRFTDLTREEKKEIMRLPWTQWMDSSFKNRECSTMCIFILSHSY